MSGVKLTKAQIKALEELRDDTRFGFRNARLGNRTAAALERQGLVEYSAAGRLFGRYWITPAGRAALSPSPTGADDR